MLNTDHLHPLIVHFPIALIIIGFLADLFSLFFKKEKCLTKTGFYLMILGALSAVAAWVTGQLFTDHPEEGDILTVFQKHSTGALVTMILIVCGALLRLWLTIRKEEESQLRWLVFILYFLAFAAVIFTGFMGGNMVYNFMLGGK